MNYNSTQIRKVGYFVTVRCHRTATAQNTGFVNCHV